MKRTKRTDRVEEKFLDVLAETCNVSEAARAARVGRRTVYQWRDADPKFAAAWDEAEQIAADKLEREAWRRGVEGIDKPVTFQGRITTTYKEYSDRMLELLLKGHRPERYSERVRSEVSGPGGGPIDMGFDGLNADERRAVREFLGRRPAPSGRGVTGA